MNLAVLLADAARRWPDRPALVDRAGGRARTLTFAELAGAVAAASARWRAAGLRPGDRVLFLHPVRNELYVALLSVFHAGLTAVLPDVSSGLSRVRDCAVRLAPSAWVAGRKAAWLRWGLGPLARLATRLGTADFAGRGAPAGGPEAVGDDHPALITFTSGSTGDPKVAVRSHGFLRAQQAALSEALGLEAGQADLVTLPVFALANLACGVTSVLADTDLARPGRADADSIRRQWTGTPVGRCAASPAFWEALLAAPGGWPASLRRVDTGGAPVFPDLLDRLAAACPGAEVNAVYGSTEAEPIAHLAQRELTEADRERCARGGGLPAGRPVSSVRVAILPDRWGRPVGPLDAASFDAMRLPAGAEGEIVVAGPHVLRGYLDGVGDAETKIHAGGEVWHRTGDAGRLEADGRLWLLGRCSARVDLPGGRGLYPLAVEASLRGIAGVRRCAYVDHAGHRVLVWEGEGGSAVAEALRRAAGWALPERIIRLDRIPVDRRHASKTDYPALHRRLGR